MLYGRALRREREILDNGVPARAVTSGIPERVADDESAKRITLDITRPDGPPYRLDYVFHAALMKAALPVGFELPIKIDPGDESRIAVEWDQLEESIAAAGGDMAAMTEGMQRAYARVAATTAKAAEAKAATEDQATKLRKLEQMRDAGLYTAQEFEAKKAELMRAPPAVPTEPPRDAAAPRHVATPLERPEIAVAVEGSYLDTFVPIAGPETDRHGRINVPGLETLALPAGAIAIYFERISEPDRWLEKAFVSDETPVELPWDLFVDVVDLANDARVPIRFPSPRAVLRRDFLYSNASKYIRFGSSTFRRPGLERIYVGRIEIGRAGPYRVEADGDWPYAPGEYVTLGAL